MVGRALLAVIAFLAAVAVTTASITACGSGGDSSTGKKTITIGFQGALSGDNQQLGINALNGLRTAIAEANADARLPFQVALAQSDDGGSPEVGPTAAQKLIDDSDVVAVVGPMFSGATKASEPLYSQAGLLSVSPSATNPMLTTLGFTTFYRVIAPDTVQGREDADYIATVLAAKKVFSLDDKSDYGTGLSAALEQQLRARGVAVVHDGINPTKDYTSEATKIIAQNPDVLFYSGYYAELALLSRALRGKGFRGVIMSGDGAKDAKYVEQAGRAAAEGTYLTCACGDAPSDPAAAAFVASYRRTTGGALPGTYSAEAYDAANALIQVFRNLGGAVGRESVLAAFGKVDHRGVSKTIRFSPTGEVADADIFIYRVQGGGIEVLGRTSDLNRS
jgi:branched-chain amino acid transport system substrate-binding protein